MGLTAIVDKTRVVPVSGGKVLVEMDVQVMQDLTPIGDLETVATNSYLVDEPGLGDTLKAELFNLITSKITSAQNKLDLEATFTDLKGGVEALLSA